MPSALPDEFGRGVKFNRRRMSALPANSPRSIRACRHPVFSNNSCTSWLGCCPMRDDTDVKAGRVSSARSSVERA